jgi:hypothetical protein
MWPEGTVGDVCHAFRWFCNLPFWESLSSRVSTKGGAGGQSSREEGRGTYTQGRQWGRRLGFWEKDLSISSSDKWGERQLCWEAPA